MKRNIVATLVGVVLSPVFWVVFFMIDMKLRLTPFGIFALANSAEKMDSLSEPALAVISFVYFPLTAFVVGIVVSLIAKTHRWLYPSLAMLPIVLFYITVLSPDRSLLSILKDFYLALSYLVLAGLTGFVFQRVVNKKAHLPN